MCGHCWTFRKPQGAVLEAAVLNVFEVAGVPMENAISMQYTDYVTPEW